METNQQKVLACVDGSTVSEAVCDYAVWMAQGIDTPLELLHTVDHHDSKARTNLSGNIGLGTQEHLLEELIQVEQQRSKLLLQQGKLMLESAKKRVVDAGIKNPASHQRHGNLVESLIDLEKDIRVLVLGMEGQQDPETPHLSRRLESIMRTLHRPMLIVNDKFKKPERIMIAYDGSEAADKAVGMVASSPLCKDLQCHLVCVDNDEVAAEGVLSIAADKLHSAGIELLTSKLQGKPEVELCAYQENHQIDLTIMGAFSHTRIHDLLLGSFTIKMLLNTKKPVLLLR
ncbi:MAG: universal stress protein [Methylococcaceae bacterium]|nr:universal stress protein [Methylococcaceae bacterium]